MTAARKHDAPAAFPLPELALEQHIAALGKTGSGKTSTTKLIVEHVVAEGYRVCVLDPIKSDWWGITSSADGKRAGLPFTVLGGPHGHAPLPAKAGKVLGELVASGKLPLSVLDMADFGPGQHQAFFIAFAETLFRKIKGVLYLVVEEAHIFAPKEQAGISGENLSIYWMKMLATGARSKGLRLIVATQRTQALHNAVLGSCDTALIHRITLPADQKPVRDWLKGNVSDKAIVAEIDSGMASLPTGAGWICACEAKVFKRLQWPRIATFDNSATPTKGSEQRTVKTAQIDVEALKALMGDAIAEAAANDPAALKAEVAKLKRELTAAQRHPAAAAKPAAGLTDAQIEKLRADAYRDGAKSRDGDVADAFSQGADAMLEQMQKGAAAARAKLAAPKARALPPPAPRNVTPARLEPIKPGLPTRHVPPPRAAQAANDGNLVAGQRRILEAVLFWEQLGITEPTRVQAAVACSMKASGGTFKTYTGALISAGLLFAPAPGRITITEAGRTQAPDIDTAINARTRLGAILVAGQGRILDAMPQDGAEISRPDLAAAADMDHTGGTFKTYLGALISIGVARATRPGFVAVESWVWS